VNFDFINKPSSEILDASLNELVMLGAIKKDELSNQEHAYDLTPIGKMMSQYPHDPMLSRWILAAVRLNF